MVVSPGINKNRSEFTSYGGTAFIMSALNQIMRVVDAHQISDQLSESDGDIFGGLITNGQYAWFASGPKMIIYSKLLGSVVSSKSFAANQKDKSVKVINI